MEMANGAKAVVRTYGGNVFSYRTADGIEVMGTRADADTAFTDAKPYAGGVPHCFPQFGPGALMQHGFARGMAFVPVGRTKESSFDRMKFKLVPTEETKKIWDYSFEYAFEVTLRDDCLEFDVVVKNYGDKPFDITLGFHNYFDVSSLSNVKIEGPFKGSSTLDRISDTESTCDSDIVTINEAVDMLYRDVTGPITITDTGKGTKITLEGSGFPDRCTWSPFGNEAQGFDKFICVEPVANSPISIAKETSFSQKIKCEKI